MGWTLQSVGSAFSQLERRAQGIMFRLTSARNFIRLPITKLLYRSEKNAEEDVFVLSYKLEGGKIDKKHEEELNSGLNR